MILRRKFLTALLVAPALLRVQPAHAVPEIDTPAPPLAGELFSGERFDLERMRGKVVLINFYSSYCRYCAYEIGLLESVYEKYRDAGLEVIAIGVDSLEDRERVARNLGMYHLPGTMAATLTRNGFGGRYPTPTAFIVDRQGFLRLKITGAKTPRHYRETILPLLDDAPAR